MSKRIQSSVGWKGPCIVLALEGHTRVHVSYRGVPVLVTPEQLRHASREEAETVDQEALVRDLGPWKGGETRQRGFIDERGPGPTDEGDPDWTEPTDLDGPGAGAPGATP